MKFGAAVVLLGFGCATADAAGKFLRIGGDWCNASRSFSALESGEIGWSVGAIPVAMIEVAGELRHLYKRWHRQWGPKSPFLLTIPNGGTKKKLRAPAKGKALNNAAMERGVVDITGESVVHINTYDKHLPAPMEGIPIVGDAVIGVLSDDGVHRYRRSSLKWDDVEHPSSSASQWMQSIDGKAMQGFVDGDADCLQVLEHLRASGMGNGQSYVVKNETAVPGIVEEIAGKMATAMGAPSAFNGFVLTPFHDAVTWKVMSHYMAAGDKDKVETPQLPPYPLPSPPFPPKLVCKGIPQATTGGDAIVSALAWSDNCSVSYREHGQE